MWGRSDTALMQDESSAVQPAPVGVTDPDRLAALEVLDILDTELDQGFDDIVRLATRLCAAPVALVSLVAADRQWFKARVNFPDCETDLSRSVCAHALAEPDLLVIPDLSADPRTSSNPLVAEPPHIRFYAGAPLRTPDGHVLGSLCVIDTVPRPQGLTTEQADDLRALASQVMTQLAMRRAMADRDRLLDVQSDKLRQAHRLDILAKASSALVSARDPGAVLEPILAAGGSSLGFEQYFIYDLAPDGQHLLLRYSVGTSEALRASLACSHIDGPLCGIVVQTRSPLVLSDILASDNPRYELARVNGLNAFAGYPIVSRGKLVGVVSFTSGASSFDTDALGFFETLARLVSGVRERLDNEKAVRESDARSRLAQEAGHVGTFEVNIETGLVVASPEMCRIYGVTEAGIYSADTFVALVLPEDSNVPSSEKTRRDGSAVTDVEYRIRRANDGAVRWIARSARFMNDETGHPASMFGTVQDITEERSAQDALRLSEVNAKASAERLQLALAAGAIIGTWVWDIPGDRFTIDEAFAMAFGLDPSLGREGIPLGQIVETVHPDDQAGLASAINEAVARGGAYAHQYRVRRLDGRYYWIEANGRVDHAPDGTPVSFPGVLIDIQARRAEEARRNALLALGDRLRDLSSVADMTIAACEILGTTLGVMLVGYGDVDAEAETITVERDWTLRGTKSLAGRRTFREYGTYIEDFKRGDTVVVTDCRTDPRTKDNAAALEAYSARAFVNTPVYERGAFVALLYVSTAEPRDWSADELGFIQEVASRLRGAVARAQAEASQAVLNQELSHRMKNLMTLVQAMADQTLRSVPDREPVVSFTKRLQALSSAHALLLGSQWESARIMAAVTATIEAFGHIERFEAKGPEVVLGANSVVSLSLVLHELATNALKYGALSNETGRVAITWDIGGEASDPAFTLRWREIGGPPAEEPTRRGFGSRLIRAGLTGTGGVALRYLPTGLEADMTAPLSHLRAS